MMIILLSSFISLMTMPYVTLAQYTGCNYVQQMVVGESYNIYSPGGNSYSANTNCRWVAQAPTGYIILANCYSMMPSSSGCVNDRLEVSLTGRIDLADAGKYCGTGNFQAQSVANQFAIALRVPGTTPGGRFNCTLTSQLAPTTTPCTCGRRKLTRIVGGVETLVNEFTMMAGLIDRSLGAGVICGATIISERYALTAAHCLINKTLSNLGLLVGDHNYESSTDTIYSALYPIAAINTHILYTGEINSQNDIAIIQTTSNIIFNEAVGPVCLPFKYTQTTFANNEVEATGWGTLGYSAPVSPTLQKVTLDVIVNRECEIAYPNVITATQLCTYTANKDTCQRDSGGPLFYTDPMNVVYLVGIVSYGTACATLMPGVSTRVTSYLQWIQDNTPGVDYCRK